MGRQGARAPEDLRAGVARRRALRDCRRLDLPLLVCWRAAGGRRDSRAGACGDGRRGCRLGQSDASMIRLPKLRTVAEVHLLDSYNEMTLLAKQLEAQNAELRRICARLVDAFATAPGAESLDFRQRSAIEE